MLRQQRGFIVSLILYGLLAAGALFTVYSAWNAFTGRYIAQGVAEQKIETDRVVAEFLSYRTVAEENAAKARAMISGIALNYADALQKETIRYVETTRIVERFIPIRERVRALPAATASVRFPDVATSLFDDAIRAANSGGTTAAITRSTGAPAANPATAAAAATVGDVTAWGVEVAEMYSTCREQITGWISFYADLRKQSPRAEVVGLIHDPHRAAVAALNLEEQTK